MTATAATLVTTYPLDGALLARQPARVSITFDRPVGISADSLKVYAPAGQCADTGEAAHAGPAAVFVALAPGLRPGTYTAAWHVTSADSYPLQGAFTFSIEFEDRYTPTSQAALPHWQPCLRDLEARLA